MALPMFVGQNSAAITTAATTGAVGAPANLQVGDFMVLIDGYGAGATLTTLAGWTVIGTAMTGGGTSTKSSAFYKIAVAADIGATFTWTYTGTTTSSVFAVVAYRGILGAAFDAQAEANTTTTQVVTTPSVTAVSKCNLLLYTRTCRDNTTTQSDAACTSAAAGQNLRSNNVVTVAGVAVHSAQIWDTQGSGAVSLVAAGSQTGLSTTSGTTTPTEGVARTISLACRTGEGFDTSACPHHATIFRAARW